MSETSGGVLEEWAAADAQEWIVKTDPADGTLIGRVPQSSPTQVSEAVQAAREAWADWRQAAPADRAAAVHAAADAVEEHADELASWTTREMGRPLSESAAGIAAGVATLRQYAELGPLHRGELLAGNWNASDFMVREPRGVVAIITPWNDPVAGSCGLLGAALVTGNTVVYKPSERTPGTGWLLARLFAGAMPRGVVQKLSGDATVGSRLVVEPVDVIAHVGSSATGARIARAAVATGAKVLLENGGKDAMVVDEDVDPGLAAEQVALGAFANAGQLCVSVERVYVHRRIADEFLAQLIKHAQLLRMGPGWDPDSRLGPLVDRALREVVHDQVTDALAQGAALGCGGEPGDGPGAFYPPTVLADCTDQMRVMREETFGPVAPVAVVDSFTDGLAKAAASQYGLAATVLTGSMANAQRAWRELPVGTVKINAVFGGAPGGAAQPRGASGSGFGYGPELLDEFTTTKVVHLEPLPVR